MTRGEDDGERECGGCGETYNTAESDANDRETYCSSECEAEDTGDDDDDDGCPVEDPDCTSRADECHDACEPGPEFKQALADLSRKGGAVVTPNNTRCLAMALRMVAAGVIEVRPDGSVWKLKNLNSSPVAAPTRIEPRRIDVVAGRGYRIVKVCFDRQQFTVQAHRLVWTVLRGPIPPGKDLNHIDGDKANNHPDNLEVCTRGENHRHAYRTGLKQRTDFARDYAERAKALRAEGLSFSKIGKALGVSQTTAFRAVAS